MRCCIIPIAAQRDRGGFAGREQFPLLLQFFDPTGCSRAEMRSFDANEAALNNRHDDGSDLRKQKYEIDAAA
jgi:hypothetical protein